MRKKKMMDSFVYIKIRFLPCVYVTEVNRERGQKDEALASIVVTKVKRVGDWVEIETGWERSIEVDRDRPTIPCLLLLLLALESTHFCWVDLLYFEVGFTVFTYVLWFPKNFMTVPWGKEKHGKQCVSQEWEHVQASYSACLRLNWEWTCNPSVGCMSAHFGPLNLTFFCSCYFIKTAANAILLL